jgi:hypothetical protein
MPSQACLVALLSYMEGKIASTALLAAPEWVGNLLYRQRPPATRRAAPQS